MVKIIWSYKAYSDYESIIEFIAKDSEHYASLTAKKIWQEIRRIEHNQWKEEWFLKLVI